MLLRIAAVVAGEVTMVLLYVAACALLYLVLGRDRTFVPNSQELSLLWLLIALPFSYGAAVVGGIVCRRIGRTEKPVIHLAALVIISGLASAIPSLSAPAAEYKQGLSVVQDGMDSVRQPAWFAFLIPFVGAAGIVTGGKWAARKG